MIFIVENSYKSFDYYSEIYCEWNTIMPEKSSKSNKACGAIYGKNSIDLFQKGYVLPNKNFRLINTKSRTISFPNI